ncbi:MAG: ArsC/Spx/MgsR family protein, partial [Helicobacter sp.]|nr:ArsC/Spx/MgsR family protein [Helicobacter sp.]
KKVKLDKGELESWLKSVSLEELFNKKGTTYKKLNLKELDLNEAEIKEWLLKEQMLIKRPVIVCKKGVLVGFDLEKYAEFFNA